MPGNVPCCISLPNPQQFIFAKSPTQSTMPPAKSKQEMQAEARAKAQKYKNEKLSPPPKKSSGAASTTKTTPKSKSQPASATKMTPKSEQLARAQKYGEQLKLKKTISPKPRDRTPVSSVDVPAEPRALDMTSHQSSSFETANWTEVDNSTINSANNEELKKQLEAWEVVIDTAEANRQRLLEQINNQCSDMDTE